MVTTGPPQGTLIIHGGGDGPTFQKICTQLARAPRVKLVVIPTGQSDGELRDLTESITHRELFGVPSVVLDTRMRSVADSKKFAQPLKEATCVIFDGGRQPPLAEAYLHTETHRELEHLLDRGGVIAGSSAGATIQGSFMLRNKGAPDYMPPTAIVDWQYPIEGFSFIKNIAIDQHITKRGRETELGDLLAVRPELLGVGIDEETAIVVKGDEFEVIGQRSVFVWNDASGPLLPLLTKGDRYNMRSRERL